MRRIDELHMEFPFAGARMLARLLRREGHEVGRRRMRTLMKRMGVEALYCKPNTSRLNAQHKIWPYLLRGLKIERANHAWALGTTYIPTARGFVVSNCVSVRRLRCAVPPRFQARYQLLFLMILLRLQGKAVCANRRWTILDPLRTPVA
jgi:transposase InsO family protein